MVVSIEEGAHERFRDEARAIHDTADWWTFVLLASVATLVTTVFTVASVLLRPGSALLWPNAAGLLLVLGAGAWTRRTRRIHVGIAVLATALMAGICAVILLQRGAHAPATVYGLATVGAVLVAGRVRLGLLLGTWLLVFTGAVTWASATGRLRMEATNPLGPDNARMLALTVATVLIAAISVIQLRRRRGMDALLERALRLTEQERDQAQRLAERRSRLVAEVGHEIRTPLTGIVGATQLLARQVLPPLQRQLVAIQEQSAGRLLNLVTAVLDQAKVESGPLTLQSAPYHLRNLVAEVAELFAPQAHRKGVEIVWIAAPALPRWLVGDALRVRQVLSNLVSNAVKFTGQGSVQIHLEGTVRGDGERRLRIEVRDTGGGVPAAQRDAIFEPFVSDASGEAQRHSTGLGLPICRELARSMGGDVELTATGAAGSRFVIDLPCVHAAGEAARSEPAYVGRLWVIGANGPLAQQLRWMLDEMGVDARFVDELAQAAGPAPVAGADIVPSSVAAGTAHGAGERPQAFLIDAWAGHGRCAGQLQAAMDLAQRQAGRLIVVNNLADDSGHGALPDAWQLFRPPREAALRDALDWAFARDVVGGAPSGAPAHGGSDGGRLAVLLVDDDTVNQVVGQAMLEVLGAEAVAVASGEQALAAAAARPFDLVLMDLQMPGLDGIATTRLLRQAEAAASRRRVPVVAMTGQADAGTEQACEQAGVDATLMKPYTVDELRAVLEGWGCAARARDARS